MINREMAFQTQFGRSGRNLPLAVGLNNTPRNDRIGPSINRVTQHKVQLAQLVATKAKAGAILPLHPQTRAAQNLAQPWHRLKRCWQLC